MAEQIEITYSDKVFKLSAGQKITFKGGKVMQGDIAVKVVQAKESEMITVRLEDSTGIFEGEYTIPKGSRADILMEYNSYFNYNSGSDVLTYAGLDLRFLDTNKFVFRDTILSSDATIYHKHFSGDSND